MARNDRIVLQEYYYPQQVRQFRIIESITVLVVLLYITLYIKILRKKQFCHPNLRFLLIAQPICHGTALTLRIFRHLCDENKLMTPILLIFFNFSSDCLLCICFQLVLAYSVERIVAMRYVDNYENMWTKRPTLGIGLFIGAALSEVLLLICWYIGLNNTLAYALQYLNFVVAASFFFVLKCYSVRAYRIVASKKEATVNERFQTSRNLKAAKLLLWLAPFKCFANFVSLYVYYWIWEEHEKEYFPYYSTFYFWMCQVQIVIQMTLTIFGHDGLKGELLRMCGCRVKIVPDTVTNVFGEKLIYTAEESPDVYFNQMKDMWKMNTMEDTNKRQAKYKGPT